jgi:hypothetical protein
MRTPVSKAQVIRSASTTWRSAHRFQLLARQRSSVSLVLSRAVAVNAEYNRTLARRVKTRAAQAHASNELS